jgi:hypothetical protein
MATVALEIPSTAMVMLSGMILLLKLKRSVIRKNEGINMVTRHGMLQEQ